MRISKEGTKIIDIIIFIYYRNKNITIYRWKTIFMIDSVQVSI